MHSRFLFQWRLHVSLLTTIRLIVDLDTPSRLLFRRGSLLHLIPHKNNEGMETRCVVVRVIYAYPHRQNVFLAQLFFFLYDD